MNNDFCVTREAICPMIFTRDFVTRENHCQIASLVNQKSLSTVTYALFFISLTHWWLIDEWVNWVITGLRYLAFLLLATSHYLNQCCQQFKPFCTKFWEISIIWCQIFSRYTGKSSPMVKYCQKLEGTLRIDQFRKLLNLRRFKSELKLTHWGRVMRICVSRLDHH